MCLSILINYCFIHFINFTFVVPTPNTPIKAVARSALSLFPSDTSKETTVEDPDSDESFCILHMGYGQRLGQPELSEEWRISFDQNARDSLYFGDHMAPFRGLMRLMRDNTIKEQSVAIRNLIKGLFYILIIPVLSLIFIR